MKKIRLLYLFYFLIKFILLSVSICWFFFHNWYVFKGKNSEDIEVYFSVGILKACFETECDFNRDEWNLFKALRILCCFYLLYIILESIIAIISGRYFKFILPAMILSILTCFFILK
ncbi:hypothetical protein HZS_7691 [Henneguya salminicola]|nr:hypothetical protein HZS_7691 [Henneguya salminicola]